MKSKLLAILALAGLASVSSAATVNIVRAGAGTGIQAQTSNGTNLTAGGYYVAVGTFFGSTPVVGADPASFQAAVNAFDIFGTFLAPTSGTTVGLVVGAVTATDTAFNSAELWLLVGNGTTKENSTEFAIIQGTPAFQFSATLGVAGSTNYTLGNASNITPLANAGTEIDNATGFDVIQLRAIPEPSVALLGVLGLFGLVRRRR